MDIKKDVQQQFGRSADSYVESKIHKEGKDLKKLVAIACLTGRETVLDVATGGGHTANAFAPFVHKVIALDLTDEMLIAAEKFIKRSNNENVEFLQGDAEKLPLSNESFDIVTCRIAPHHFPNVKNFIDEVNRVLTQGGQFLLDDNVAPEDDEFDHFYNKVEKMRDYSHFRAWKKTEWMTMLELSGFEIHETYRFEKMFQFDPWCHRMNLSQSAKEQLTEFILGSPAKVKTKFKVEIKDNKIMSFQGESILIKAVKG
jgi:ubiquinone/menaquinone biosynthesis C-methylase UbiE